MKAVIKPYHAGPNHGHIIVITDNEGKPVEQIAVTDVVLEGAPLVSGYLDGENRFVISRQSGTA